jgi:hypothetical protein
MLISSQYQPGMWACSAAVEVMLIIHSENSCKLFYFTTLCTNRGKLAKQFYIVSLLIIFIIIIIIIIIIILIQILKWIIIIQNSLFIFSF